MNNGIQGGRGSSGPGKRHSRSEVLIPCVPCSRQLGLLGLGLGCWGLGLYTGAVLSTGMVVAKKQDVIFLLSSGTPAFG